MNANLVESAANTAVATVFPLQRDAYGKLIWTTADNERLENVVPIRAFPIQSPDVGISLVNLDGQEVAWIEELAAVPEPAQTLIRNELATREFMPVITQIVGVASYSTPCTWTVKTDRGDTAFVLRGDEDIRRIGTEGTLLISDSHGIQYLVRDHFALDVKSKKILDRFL